MALLRIYLYGVLAAFLIWYFVGGTVAQLRASQTQVSTQQHQIADFQSQVAELESTVDDLRSRWIGEPGLWQPTGIPANVTVAYYAVSGTTQPDLIQSLAAADICAKNNCLPDPGTPPGSTAVGLESNDYIDPNTTYCYDPHALSYHWRSHTITMPQWSPKPGVPKITTVQAWNALEGVIWIHELGHVTVAENWLAAENQQSAQLSSCTATFAFWSDPHLFDSLNAANLAYHARLRADCRPEIGCIPTGWMGW